LSRLNDENAELFEMLYNDKNFPKEDIFSVLDGAKGEAVKAKMEILSYIKDKNVNFSKEVNSEIVRGVTHENIYPCFIADFLRNELEVEQYEKLKNNAPSHIFKKLTNNFSTLLIAVKFANLYGKENFNELSSVEKKEALRNIMGLNNDLFHDKKIKNYFPFLPKNQDEYCNILSELVKSISIKTDNLSDLEIENFYNATNKLSKELSVLSDEEFNKLEIRQEYSKNEFIINVLKETENLTKAEKDKVFDYFGFELYQDSYSKIGYSLSGYPSNSNDDKALSQIKNNDTKLVVEKLKYFVDKFNKDNKVVCNNKKIEPLLNDIFNTIPEMRTMINKKQHNTHDFDTFKHSLKVMQKITQDSDFEKLSKGDKKLLLLASLTHDITKREYYIDKTHPNESAFDTFYITKKLNLSRDEEIKLFSLIKHHDWYEKVNTNQKTTQSTAFDMQYDNLFDMATIFTKADLMAVKKDDEFYDKYSDELNPTCMEIKKYIAELQKTRPILPTTKIPNASSIREKVTIIKSDGSTNLKGLYIDKNGLVIIKYNEVEDWEALGFEKNSISKGICATDKNNAKINTGNIKFIAHGLETPDQLANFGAFSLPDSDALLSVSYMERPESKYRLFRPQGILLDVNTKYIYGGGETDSGSGCHKNIEQFKKDYVFGGKRESDRRFISNLIKETLDLSDEEYIEFLKNNENKSWNEITPVEYQKPLLEAFAKMSSKKRHHDREYNEMYVSNPKITAVFAYSMQNSPIGNPVEFLNSTIKEEMTNMEKMSNAERTSFLKEYAIKNDVPFVVFGD